MELLIKAIDAFHRDSEEDAKGCYKRGDPVVCMQDGHNWGRLEVAPTFWKVRLEWAQASVLQPFVEPLFDGIWARTIEMPRQIIRRRWNFKPELLENRQRMALFRGDVVPINWSTWLRCVHDKSQQRARGILTEVA